MSARGEVTTDSYYNTTPDKYNATYFHFYGIEADNSTPFRLHVNSIPEFKSMSSLDKVIVKLNLKEPKVAAEHIIRISLTAPAHGSITASKEKRFNITYNGPHFLIAANGDSEIQILQRKDGDFSDVGFSGAVPYASKNEGLYEKVDYVNKEDEPVPEPKSAPKSTYTPTTTTTSAQPQKVVQHTVEYDESLLNDAQKEKLNKYRELREKGILTKRDFEKRLGELFSDVSSNSSSSTSKTTTVAPSATVSASPSSSTAKPVPSASVSSTAKSVDLSKYQLSTQEKEDLAKLEKFHQSGILTSEEYAKKRDMVLANAKPAVQEPKPVQQTITANKQPSDDQKEQLAKLQKFVDMGILTQDEFEQKKKLVLGSSEPSSEQKAEPKLTDDQREQLAKLQKFVDMGILTQDEFEKKKEMVLASSPSEAKQTTETPKKSIPVTVNGNEAPTKTSTQLNVHITNIKASSDKPFKLVLNGQHTMYQASEDIPETKEVVVKGDIPHWSNEDLVVKIGVSAPAIGVEAEHELNLTRDGKFVQIGVNNAQKQLSVKQQTSNTFDALNAASKAPQAFKASGKTDIFLRVRGLKGSPDKPFRILYMEREIFSTEEDMPNRQVGVINGTMLKERRSNRQEDEDHEVLLTIQAPKLGILDATATINLTRDGGKLSVELNGEEIVVKQSVNDESFESDFKVVPLLITKEQTTGLSEQDFELLAKLKQLFDAGVLSEEEYENKKNAVLNK